MLLSSEGKTTAGHVGLCQAGTWWEFPTEISDWRFFAVCPQTFKFMAMMCDDINRLHNMTASFISRTDFVCNWECLISWYDTSFCLWDKTNLNQFEGSRKNCACMSVTLWLHTLHVCESECEDARTSLRASLFLWLVCREFVLQCLNHACAQAKDCWLSNVSEWRVEGGLWASTTDTHRASNSPVHAVSVVFMLVCKCLFLHTYTLQ